MGLFLLSQTNCFRLQDRQRVVDDQTELVDIAFALVSVGAVPCLTDTEGQIFGRASLYYVFGFNVGFVVLAIFTVQTGVGAVWSECWCRRYPSLSRNGS